MSTSFSQQLHIMSVILIILDGWGYAPDSQYNAIAQAHTPHWDEWLATCPHTMLDCAGPAVGLPPGQMGNSEVGHMHIGAGRTILQELSRIDQAIASGDFANNSTLITALRNAQQQQCAVHVCGLLSPGGVHSHEQHLFALLRLASTLHVSKVYIHAILDGRDTPPRSAQASLVKLEDVIRETGCGQLATITGRYYAMDRDHRWDRTQLAFDCMVDGRAPYHAIDAQAALAAAYERGENDEFVMPTIIGQPHPMQDNDSLIFMNFRADRMRQIVRACTQATVPELQRGALPTLAAVISLTPYATDIATQVVFAPQTIRNNVGSWLAQHHLQQLRIAETEKYAHVTFFFNGGVETAFPGEKRILIPSPKVATYDLQPEMSARELTRALITAIAEQRYDAIICNFANADMVGHTGNFAATVRAIECLDDCLGSIIAQAKQYHYDVLITADHGNAEKMFDADSGQVHTAHTTTPVPLLYIGKAAGLQKRHASLLDVAPTLLDCLGLTIPSEMTGKSLLVHEA